MGRRKRQKSSPAQKQSIKKYRFSIHTDISNNDCTADSEGEGTEYFDSLDFDTDFTSPPTPPTTLPMEMKFSQEDINELSSKLAPILIKDLKSALKEEVLKDLRQEITEIVQKETQELKDEIIELKNEVTRLKSEIKTTQEEHDELAQYGRRMCLDISGIPGDNGKSDEDVESKILKQAKDIGLPLDSSDIDKCHRKGKPLDNVNRKVIVKFTNSKARQRVYNSRKEFGAGIYVQENLTPYREYLSFQARQLKRDNLVTKTWVAGCKLFVQVAGEKKGRFIKNIDDINAIRDLKSPFPV